MDNAKFVSGKEVKKYIKIADATLRRWGDSGKVETIRSNGGKRLYNINQLVAQTNRHFNKKLDRKKYCYCRVSSIKQVNDLKRQEDFLKDKYPNHVVLSDIGSGINFKRKNFCRILQESINDEVEELIIIHKDRLARFSFNLLEYIFKCCRVNFVVLDQTEHKPKEQELAEDLLAFIQIFNCKQMGSRRYNKKNSTTDKNCKDKNEIKK